MHSYIYRFKNFRTTYSSWSRFQRTPEASFLHGCCVFNSLRGFHWVLDGNRPIWWVPYHRFLQFEKSSSRWSSAYNNGDPSAVLAPKDSSGLRCGIDDGVSTKKYLFFFDILKCVDPSVPFLGCPTPQVNHQWIHNFYLENTLKWKHFWDVYLYYTFRKEYLVLQN